MTDAITVRFDDAAVLARLAEIARRVDNMAPAMKSIGEVLSESTKKRFGTSTGPDGQKWERLAASTVLARLEQITGTYAAYTNVKTRKEGLRRIGDKKGAYLKDGSLSTKSRRALEAVLVWPLAGLQGPLLQIASWLQFVALVFLESRCALPDHSNPWPTPEQTLLALPGRPLPILHQRFESPPSS